MESLSQLFAATGMFVCRLFVCWLVSLCLGLTSLVGETRACAHSRRHEPFWTHMSWQRRQENLRETQLFAASWNVRSLVETVAGPDEPCQRNDGVGILQNAWLTAAWNSVEDNGRR